MYGHTMTHQTDRGGGRISTRKEKDDVTRRDGMADNGVSVTVEVPTGLAESQFRKIIERLKDMSDSMERLNTEIADVRATQELISASVEGLRTNLTEAQAQNAALTEQIAALTADAATSQATIDGLNAAAAATSTAIDAAATELDAVDEALEGVSGENAPA